MILFFLLVIPGLLGLAGLFFSKGRVTWKEWLIHEGVMTLVICMGYYLALCNRTQDVEIWNGTVAEKHQYKHTCCHTYSCDCHEVCSGSGKDRSCHTECDTCYEHGPRKYGWNGDRGYSATSTNDELIYDNDCNAPNDRAPQRWVDINIGEPTAIEHNYTNYIKGNPDSILRRQGAAERFKGRLPDYPRVYDHYMASRFLLIGIPVQPEHVGLDWQLAKINGNLGARKQVNIIVVVVKEGDLSYLEALRETWLGGKKNDFVVVIGAPNYPSIDWVGVLSWTKNEELKVEVRDEILALKQFQGDRILQIIEQRIEQKFVRRPMSDFDYLKATIEPTKFATWFLFILGLVLALGMQVFFWFHDPFGDRPESHTWKRRY